MFTYLYSLLFTVLASETTNWVFTIFRAARAKIISAGSISTELATGVAALIIVFSMIKLSYEIMSDDQHAGFSGVSLWRILRPMVILLLLQSGPLWLGVLDKSLDTITTQLVKATDAQARKADIGMAYQVIDDIGSTPLAEVTESAKQEKLSEIDAEIAKMKRYKDTGVKSYGENPLGPGRWGKIVNVDTRLQDLLALKLDWQQKTFEDKDLQSATNQAIKHNDELTKDQKSLLRGVAEEYAKMLSALRSASSDNPDVPKAIKLTNRNAIFTLCIWLYDNAYIIVECAANLFLAILAMMLPWILAFSLLDLFKDSFKSFLTSYIQISFWKVLAAMINYVVILMRTATIGFLSAHAKESLAGIYSDTELARGLDPVSADAAIAICAMICVAGIVAILKISSLTSAILPTSISSSSSGIASVADSGMVGSAAGGIAGAAWGGAKGAVTAVTGMGGGSSSGSAEAKFDNQ